MLFLNCYSLFSNTCTGYCQGCSDYPIATSFRMGSKKPVTRLDMILNVIENIKVSFHVKRLFRVLNKDPEFRELMEDLAKYLSAKNDKDC
jgi:hypothetical protein